MTTAGGSPREVRRWRGTLRRLYAHWLERHALAPSPKVVRLHVEQPLLGAGQLRFLARRVLGFEAARETFRKVLIRRRDLVGAPAFALSTSNQCARGHGPPARRHRNA
jgi:hypothetical protein